MLGEISRISGRIRAETSMRSVDGNRGSVVGNRARGSPGPGNYGAQKAGHFWAGGGGRGMEIRGNMGK